MTRTMTVIRKEYLERVRAKSFILGTILVPALMSLVIVIPMLIGDKDLDQRRVVGVVSTPEVFLQMQEIMDAREGKVVDLQAVACADPADSGCLEKMKTMILEEEIHSGVVIPADFIETEQVAFYNRSVRALVVKDEVLRPVLNLMLRTGRFEAAEVDEGLYDFLMVATRWNNISVGEEGVEKAQNEDATFALAMTLIMIIYIMIIMYGNHTLTAVIEEKNTRMVEVLLSSLSPDQLMLGKVLGIGLAGLTQFAIWTGAIIIASAQGISIGDFSLDMGYFTPLIMGSFIIFFLLGFFLYATLFAGVGAMCNSIQDSQQFATPLTMGLVIPMLLLTLVLTAPDSTLSVVLSLFPLFSPMLMFMRVCIETPPLWQIGLSWLIMALSIWGAAKMAGKLFRLGILMYGTTPTWATLVRVLRA